MSGAQSQFGTGGQAFGVSPIAGDGNSQDARKHLAVPLRFSVTDTKYGAVDDGYSDYFLATWTSGGATISAFSGIGVITVSNTGPNGVAYVTSSTTPNGNMVIPRQDWVGKPIAISGAGAAGGIFVGKVVNFFYNTANGNAATAVLNMAVPTPVTAQSKQLMCPCFTSGKDGSGMPSIVGKTLWVSNCGIMSGSSGASPQGAVSATPSEYIITGVTSPYALTLDDTTRANTATNIGSRLSWGTNNTTAIVAAGQDALLNGAENLYFPGGLFTYSTGLFCGFSFMNNSGVQTATDFLAGGVCSGLNWIANNATTFVSTGARFSDGNSSQRSGTFDNEQLYKIAIGDGAQSIPGVKKCIEGINNWPRLANLGTIVALVVGDSWANEDPTGQSNAVWGPFAMNLQKQNASKTVHFIPGSAISGLTWYQLSTNIAAATPVQAAQLGSVVPDLVCLFVTGGNDSGSVSKNDIMYCVNIVKSWGTSNGIPPDVILLTGTYPRTMDEFSSSTSHAFALGEYASVLQRSIARKNNYALMDLARHAGFALRGWSEDQLTLRQVPPVGSAAISPRSNSNYAGYVVPYKCRDFFMAIQLGSTTGQAFWAAVGNLQLQISPKPDNLLTLSIDGSNNLNVSAQTWGYTVPTTVTMANGSASFVTSGQTTLASITSLSGPSVPGYGLTSPQSPFNSSMMNQCFFAPSFYYNTGDFRTFIIAYTNNGILIASDANNLTQAVPTSFWGGQMFTNQDATANIDVIVQNAGTVAHPFTGANSLVTKCIGYTSKTSVTLGAVNSQAGLSASVVNVFIGSISVQPTYSRAVTAGNDVGGFPPILTIKKTNSHFKIGYITGAASYTDIRVYIQTNEKILWEGEVEVYGGPFFPRLFTSLGASTISIPYIFIDDPYANLRQTSMTMRKAFGTGDAAFGALYGGDGGHPGQAYIHHVAEEVSAVQDMNTGTNYSSTFGINVPVTGFSYTIPANQNFTELNPAGTLATGTIILPSVFQQGSRMEIFSTQTVTALTVSAPSGFTIVGTAVTTITANQTLAYRLVGTTFIRTA